MAIIHDFHQVVAGSGFEQFQSPVVDDQQVEAGQGFEQFAVAAVGLGLGQRQDQARESIIADAIAFEASLMAQRTSEVSFAIAAGAG